jgi:hypothetical protein
VWLLVLVGAIDRDGFSTLTLRFGTSDARAYCRSQSLRLLFDPVAVASIGFSGLLLQSNMADALHR